jgi:hypothetical protein
MEEWINLILFIVFGAVALIARALNRRRSQAEPDIVQEEAEVTLPPWGNLPMEEEIPISEFIEEEAPAAQPVPPPDPQVTSKPDLAKEETQVQSPVDPMIPTILGIPLSPQTFRQGIILAEILRPPKSLREPRQ